MLLHANLFYLPLEPHQPTENVSGEQDEHIEATPATYLSAGKTVFAFLS